ncbi:MAG: hypothetical protein ACLQBQ_01325 [Smithella sp.]
MLEIFIEAHFQNDISFDTDNMNHQMKLHSQTLKYSGESSKLEEPFLDVPEADNDLGMCRSSLPTKIVL